MLSIISTLGGNKLVLKHGVCVGTMSRFGDLEPTKKMGTWIEVQGVHIHLALTQEDQAEIDKHYVTGRT